MKLHKYSSNNLVGIFILSIFVLLKYINNQKYYYEKNQYII